jgi:1-acyl-sn-glycerol-3-phosphate acyltransferase
MLHLLRRIYTIWCLIWFFAVFILLWPFFWTFLQSKKTYWLANWCNRVWTVVVYSLSFLPLKIVYRFKPEKGQAYVFCPNHTSYIDIPVMLWGVKSEFSFLGKSSLGKVPFIGYMYKRLNILVDRKSAKNRVEAYQLACETLEQGKSMVVFAEGTISKNAPYMNEFRDGAFRMAVEKQKPIVPVTMPFNWLILPDDGKWLGKPNIAMAIFHEPIDTKGMTMDDVPMLMRQTRQIIEEEIRTWNTDLKQKEDHVGR